MIFIVLTGLIIFGSVVWYESYTGHFRLSRIDKASNLLEKLADLSPKVEKSNNENLSNIFKSISNDLESYVSHNTTPFSINSSILKSMAAAVPWVLFAMLLPFVGEGGTKQAIAGIVLASVPFIIGAAYLPDFEQSWLNYFAYPFGHFVLVVSLVMLWQSKKTH